MFDELSQWLSQGRTPESTMGLLSDWTLSAVTAALLIYLFISNIINIAFNPIFVIVIPAVGAVVGFMSTAHELESGQSHKIYSNNILRFVIVLICGAIGVTVALLSPHLYGYLAIGLIGVMLGAVVARTMLYVRSRS